MSCRVTDNLPRELNTIDDGKWARGSVNLSFPGVLLSSSSRLCAAIGFQIDAGAVLSVAEPMFCDPETPEIQSAWMLRLFDEVRAECSRRNCTSVRAIEPANVVNDSQMVLLTGRGFSIKATICQWIRRLSDSDPTVTTPLKSGLKSSDPELRDVPCRALGQDADLRGRVELLLRHVLADAMDLVTLPSPDPDELLDDWIQQGATLLLAEYEGTLIGLCCVVAVKFDAAESLIDEIQIQYIGVVSEFRSRGIASLLIHSIAPHFSGQTASVELTFTTIAAFCDNLNIPAKRLYAASGFEQRSEFNVWCCHVDATDSKPILSSEALEL